MVVRFSDSTVNMPQIRAIQMFWSLPQKVEVPRTERVCTKFGPGFFVEYLSREVSAKFLTALSWLIPWGI